MAPLSLLCCQPQWEYLMVELDDLKTAIKMMKPHADPRFHTYLSGIVYHLELLAKAREEREAAIQEDAYNASRE